MGNLNENVIQLYDQSTTVYAATKVNFFYLSNQIPDNFAAPVISGPLFGPLYLYI
jgi:hypothetical protein